MWQTFAPSLTQINNLYDLLCCCTDSDAFRSINISLQRLWPLTSNNIQWLEDELIRHQVMKLKEDLNPSRHQTFFFSCNNKASCCSADHGCCHGEAASSHVKTDSYQLINIQAHSNGSWLGTFIPTQGTVRCPSCLAAPRVLVPVTGLLLFVVFIKPEGNKARLLLAPRHNWASAHSL